MLSLGIVGLPNVGKSTLFNALTAGAAKVSNYPFTTIDSNVGVVPVPDLRLEALAERIEPEEAQPCHLEVIDIAGLVEGASRGEGLGNRFLESIRQVDAIAHVLRCFEDPDVAHVFAVPDPPRDREVVETELLLADLDVLGRAVEKRRKQWATDPRAHAAERDLLERCLAELEAGRPLAALDLSPEDASRLRGLGMLTGKPVLYVANVGEEELAAGEERAAAAWGERLAAAGQVRVVAVSARIESELAQLDPEERGEFMRALGIERSGLERVIAAAFERLDLIRFYTVAHRKLRAWEVPRGTTAPRAAGRVHTDMESGFVRAEVVSADELLAAGGLAELRQAGKVRIEGKEYPVRDGDVLQFLFHG